MILFANMPRVKRVKSQADICMNFIFENQEIFSERFSIGELEVCRNTNALDSDKPSTNPFDDLRINYNFMDVSKWLSYFFKMLFLIIIHVKLRNCWRNL